MIVYGLNTRVRYDRITLIVSLIMFVITFFFGYILTGYISSILGV